MGDFHELNLEKNVWRTVRYQTVADMGGNSSSTSTSSGSGGGGGGGGLNPSSRRASTGGCKSPIPTEVAPKRRPGTIIYQTVPLVTQQKA